MPSDCECWTPEPIWRGQTAFILGGGPSLAALDLGFLRGRCVIAINSSYRLCPEPSAILFFGDYEWPDYRPGVVEMWAGPVVTTSYQAKQRWPRVKFVESTPPGQRARLGVTTIIDGESSGHSAVSLAAALGATRIVLLGFDMRTVGGRSNWHDDYGFITTEECYEAFRNHFIGWNAMAERAGICILNATKDSALTEFPMVDLKALI